jgi:2'-5' RNA ligase
MSSVGGADEERRVVDRSLEQRRPQLRCEFDVIDELMHRGRLWWPGIVPTGVGGQAMIRRLRSSTEVAATAEDAEMLPVASDEQQQAEAPLNPQPTEAAVGGERSRRGKRGRKVARRPEVETDVLSECTVSIEEVSMTNHEDDIGDDACGAMCVNAQLTMSIITVTSPSINAVRTKLNIVLDQLLAQALSMPRSRNSGPGGAAPRESFTHFLAVPLGTNGSSAECFGTAIEEMKQLMGDESRDAMARAFQRPVKIHLTLLMLTLPTEEHVSRAQALLHEATEAIREVVGSEPCAVTLAGLRTMNNNAAKARVAYMAVVEDEIHRKLTILVQVLTKVFSDAGFCAPQQIGAPGPLLHATLMNAKWLRGKRRAMDLTDIFTKFGERQFGQYPIGNIDLNSLTGELSRDGYYNRIATLPLTTPSVEGQEKCD